MKDRLLITTLLILLFLVIGVPLFVFLNKANKTKIHVKPKVAVTIFPIYDIVKNIAGDKIDVNLILPVGASEHTYDPSPLDVSRLEKSVLVFKVGKGLDDWVEKIVDNKIPRVDLSASVNLIKLTNELNSFDPHYWLSIDNALLIANKTAIELSKIDPLNQKVYEANLLSYNKQLNELQVYMDQTLADEKDKGIITFHDAFTYLASDYGIKILATIEPFAGKEPTPLYLSQVEDIVKSEKVKVLFKEPQLSSDLLISYANDFGIKILTLDPLGGSGQADSYITMMKFNAKEIKKGLSL